jgi:hypothetical protein
MIKTTGGQKIDTIFVLIIFCVFALSVLMVLMLGASVYSNMTDITRTGQDERTLLSYVWTKVKNGDDAGSIYVGEFCGLPALCFDEEYGELQYQTAIYHYDGWVYELFYEKGYDFSPEDGVQIMEIDDLRFEEYERGLIKVSSGANSMLVSPRGGHKIEKLGMGLDEGGIPE